MKLMTYDWAKVNSAVQDIAMNMYKDNWRPGLHYRHNTWWTCTSSTSFSHDRHTNAYIMCAISSKWIRRKY